MVATALLFPLPDEQEDEEVLTTVALFKFVRLL